MQTVCLLNQKGGVGKTSTCYHLAGALAGLGLRVVLVDNDPQASLPQGFFGPEGRQSFPPETTVAAAYDPDESPIASTLIRPTGFRGVGIIPGSPALTAYNMTPPEAWGPSIAGLRDLLADLDADVALIDCPPNLHLCSVAALTAADALVVPLQAEDFGSQGLGPVRQAVAGVREALNPDLQLAGYPLTMYDKRLGIHLAYEAKLREMFGADVFASTFPLAKDFKESVASRQPIGFYKPKSAAAKAARAVAEELLERLGQGGEVAEGRAA
jgi:chromosome partitioning protein